MNRFKKELRKLGVMLESDYECIPFYIKGKSCFEPGYMCVTGVSVKSEEVTVKTYFNTHISVMKMTRSGELIDQKGNKEMKGFTFYLDGKDYFVVTEKERKTTFLAGQILRNLGIRDGVEERKWLVSKIRKGKCELKTLPNGRQYYDIHGNGFGGYGDFVDSGKTVIINM